MEAAATTRPLKKERILKIPIDAVRQEDIDAVLGNLLDQEGVRPIVFLSFWDLLRARRNRELREWVEAASLVIPTSLGILRAARFLKKTIPSIFFPFDLVIRLFRLMEEKGLSLYLLGGKPLHLQQAERNLKQTFPGLKVVGRYTGYYPESVEEDILLAMKKASPHCILLGSGLKGRDRWAYLKQAKLTPSILIYSPLTFDIISGKRLRPSRESIEKGHDCIHELTRQPWRIFRSIVYLYSFLLLLVYRIRKL